MFPKISETYSTKGLWEGICVCGVRLYVWGEVICENRHNIIRASNITLELCTTWFILLLDLRTYIVSYTIAGTEVVVFF